jgi:hypothetical protein
LLNSENGQTPYSFLLLNILTLELPHISVYVNVVVLVKSIVQYTLQLQLPSYPIDIAAAIKYAVSQYI